MLADLGSTHRPPPALLECVHHQNLLDDVLNVIPAATLIIDRDLKILHANAQARVALCHATQIFTHQRRLRCHNTVVLNRIRSAVRRGQDLSLALPACDGHVTIAHIKMLAARHDPAQQSAIAAVLISQSVAEREAPVDALAELFGLTPSETRVLAHVVAGRRRRQTAFALGLSDATVATHLRNIFMKTGAPDRFALCQIASTLTWPATPPVHSL